MSDADVAIGLLRLALGVVFCAYGCRKLFGWFGGSGLRAAGSYFATLGFRPAGPLAAVAAASELAGGVLLLTGALWPAGPVVILGTMTVAAGTQSAQGFWAVGGGAELPVVYAVAAASLLFLEPGRFAVPPELPWAAGRPLLLVLVLGAAAVLLLTRRRA